MEGFFFEKKDSHCPHGNGEKFDILCTHVRCFLFEDDMILVFMSHTYLQISSQWPKWFLRTTRRYVELGKDYGTIIFSCSTRLRMVYSINCFLEWGMVEAKDEVDEYS